MPVHQWLADWSSWGWPLLANHLWQATLLALVAFTAAAALRRVPGRARYVLWLIASAKFLLPSILLVSMARGVGIDVSSLSASDTAAIEASSVVYQLTTPIVRLSESDSSALGLARRHNELLCALTAVWLIGFVALLALWLKRRQRFRLTMSIMPDKAAARERQALNHVGSCLGIKREVRLGILPRTIEPGVWGVWSPVVLLPERMADELTDAELEAVMMHEMVHVARWDNLVANMHRFICCLFWFHPIIWLLDRQMLAERERACDEAVLALGGRSDVYASSLLKVLRFCLGWSVAGASNATASNLGRRVERIMSKNLQLRLSLWHRAAVGSTAALIIILSIAAGILTRDGVVAQSTKSRESVPSGAPGGATELAIQDNVIQGLDQAPETAVEFKNSAKAPLVITDARVRAVPRAQNGPGDEYAAVPVVTLFNNTNRRIVAFALEFRNGIERRAYLERVSPPLDPRIAFISGRQRRFVILPGGPDAWSVRVVGVGFEDGEAWGMMPPPPPPPPPPANVSGLLPQIDQAPEVPLQTESVQSPLSIIRASGKAVKASALFQQRQPDLIWDERYMMRLKLQLLNNTSKRITDFAVELVHADGQRQTYVSKEKVLIEAGAYFTLGGFEKDGSFTIVSFFGAPDLLKARVAGVKFEDGEIWGAFREGPPPPPPSPPLPAQGELQASDSAKLMRKSGGVLMTSATNRVDAEYPPLARAAMIIGSVVVEVTVDEGGAVISARAISGHPLLKDSAVSAARQWQFAPTMLSGVPVKVIGTLTFFFEP